MLQPWKLIFCCDSENDMLARVRHDYRQSLNHLVHLRRFEDLDVRLCFACACDALYRVVIFGDPVAARRELEDRGDARQKVISGLAYPSLATNEQIKIINHDLMNWFSENSFNTLRKYDSSVR